MPSCTKLLLSAAFAILFASNAQSQSISEYAVKFVCGTQTTKNVAVVAPGVYFTAINVHNPSKEGVKFKKKVAIALSAEKGGPISALVDAGLSSDQAFEIDCPDILKIVGPEILKGLGNPTFLKGFVVIQSAIELDVVTVYTAAGTASGPVSAMEISRAPARKM